MSTSTEGGRVPVSIITGFLGSGKTTLLNRLLRHPGMNRAAVIVNEFGEIGLDHLLMETPNETAVLLDNGCICCTVRGDLVETLRGLIARRGEGAMPEFDRVLIETTGLADPVPLIQTIVTDPKVAPRYSYDSVVTVVDAVNGDATLDAHPEAAKQAALADRLLVSKSDIAADGSVSRLCERLQQVNPGAEQRVIMHGDVDPSTLFGAGLDAASDPGVREWLRAERYRTDIHGHRHRDDVRSFAIWRDEPVTRTGLALWLNMVASLKGAQLLRCKGLLNVEGRPVAVHAVQTVIHEPRELDSWPDGERRSRLVFITQGLSRDAVERTLEALNYQPVVPAKSLAIDPEAYARFVRTAERFR